MEAVFWQVLRRMRAPLILLVSSYAISIAGLVLIPGRTAEGAVWHFDFLHAFYFVAYMGSTIGFGEIPHAFSPGQRLWVSLCIFLTVVSWLYAITRILSLVQDQQFRNAISEARFVRATRRLTQPFWIVCGYGETGSLLVNALARRGVQCVVMDRRETAINRLRLEGFAAHTPALCGNASDTLQLLEAGMRRRLCRGVIAMTNENEDNIRISVTARLIRPELQVIARAGTREAADNLASFDTDYVIHPYSIFSEHLLMTQQRPSLHVLHAWLISLPGYTRDAPPTPPYGRWVICGYGRFGRAAAAALEAAGNTVTVIEPDPARAPKGAIIGRGTEAGPLREAGIAQAVGIVCGTDSDPNTLSAVMTARALKPDLYVIARQDSRADGALYRAAHIDMVMEISRLTVWRILPMIKAPLLADFLAYMRERDEDDADAVLRVLQSLCRGITPETWAFTVNALTTPAVVAEHAEGAQVTINHLLCDPRHNDGRCLGLPLLLMREEEAHYLPENDTPLLAGDRLLLSTVVGARQRIEFVLANRRELAFRVRGRHRPDGALWRWWTARRPQ